MIIKDFIDDPDTHWSAADELYLNRFVPSTLISVWELEEFILDDLDYQDRIISLYEELGTPNQERLVNTAHELVSAIKLMKQKEEVIKRCGVLEPLDEYRLFRGFTLYSSTLANISQVEIVEYDSEESWFARGFDGTLLEDEEAVTSYKSSVLLERKYHDSTDELSLWGDF